MPHAAIRVPADNLVLLAGPNLGLALGAEMLWWAAAGAWQVAYPVGVTG